jgi:hypothetical protein
MNRIWYKTLTALLWLAPVAMGLSYWQLWDRLPVRMASHFDAAGHANGWMSRAAALYFDLGFLIFLSALFSLVLYAVQEKYPLAKLSWALLAFFQVEIWALVYMLDSTLAYNLDGRPISVAPLLVATPIGVLAVVVLAFAENRGHRLPAADVIAEEVNSGKVWSPVFLLPVLVVAMLAIRVPSTGARLWVVVAGVIFVPVFAIAWDGFHYLFTRQGIEIRTLGFRLKSVPLLQIKRYEIQDWSPAGGYGIRGIGNHKAYVWGKRGVRVEMFDGEIFLGHNDPQRIVHDLNVITHQPSS